MKSRDVFTPTGLPTVTLVRDHLEKAVRSLGIARETGGYLVSLIGPSKSGKTVFIEDQVGRERLIHVTGAGITDAATLWKRVFHIIGTPKEKLEMDSISAKLIGETAASAGIPVIASLGAKVGGEVGVVKTTSETRHVDYLQLLISELKGTGLTLFVDDFHYIATEAQGEIAEEIKEAVRQGLTIVCAAVPYHSDDVIRSNRDLTGRIMRLDFDYWNKDQLLLIASLGFRALKIDCPIETAIALANEASGSPQLMQALCLNACVAMGVKETCENETPMPKGKEFIDLVCLNTVMTTDFSSVLAKMREGPKTRGMDRSSHQVKGGEIEDVYPIVIRAIRADPPQLTLRYEDLKNRIAKICTDGGPSGSSVTGACAHMARLANEQANNVLLEWDGPNDVLDIRDPYLLFFIRWEG